MVVVIKAYFYCGVLLCVGVVANIVLWIITSTKKVSFDQAAALYLNYFPSFLKNTTLLTLLGIALSSLSVFLLTRSQKTLGSGYRQISLLLTTLNIILISWQVFSLM